MINNALELTKFLSTQAQNSGFAKSGFVVVLDNNGVLHKTEFGFSAQNEIIENAVVKNEVLEMNPVESLKEAEDIEKE